MTHTNLLIFITILRPTSRVHVRGKERDFKEGGFVHNTVRLAAISQVDLLSTVRELNGNPNVDDPIAVALRAANAYA